MITYKEAKRNNAFCQCDDCLSTYTEEDETGSWAVCAACSLPIEGSFVMEGGDYLQSLMLGEE